MLFGSKKDFNLINKINRELLEDIVEQEILYYKYSLEESITSIYGESTNKIFWTPVKLNCLVTRGDQVITDKEFGPDLEREASFAILREALEDVNVVPEVGDIILWEESYFEVDTVRENQLFVGRDSNYNLTHYGPRFGSSLSIILDCHMTRGDKLGITSIR